MGVKDGVDIYSAAELRGKLNNKKYQSALVLGHADNVHRLRRAIGWLELAQRDANNLSEVRFILHWIAFNALYGQGDKVHNGGHAEIGMMEMFLKKVIRFDKDHLIWNALSGKKKSIGKILFLRQVYKQFWDAMYDEHKWKVWHGEFDSDNRKAAGAADAADEDDNQHKAIHVSVFVRVLFERLYVVRNQLMHGAASVNLQNPRARINRAQVKNGAEILKELVPIFITIVLHKGDIDLGRIPYPRVGEGTSGEVDPPQLWLEGGE